jgi:MFS family permease
MLIGASFWGYIADRHGRKYYKNKILQFNVHNTFYFISCYLLYYILILNRFGLAIVSVVISVFGLASTFSPNVQVLVVLRGTFLITFHL